MVIYSSSRDNNKDIFDKLAGKDTWIKVKSNTGRLLWLRIVRTNKDTMEICFLDNDKLKGQYSYSCSDKIKSAVLSVALRFKKSMFTVVEPIEYLTSEEIFNILEG